MTMLRVAPGLMLCVACGAQPSPTPDGSALQPVAALAHATLSGPLTGSTATIEIPSTSDGDALVVTIASPGVTHSVTVGGVQLDSWFLARDEACATTEMWVTGHPTKLPANATSLEVASDGSATFSIGVFELAGVATVVASDDAGIAVAGAAPTLPAERGDLVISTLTSCTPGVSLAATTPFTPVDTDDAGTSVAYVAPTVAGSFGASWTHASDRADATTVVFR